jgi:hypothetical protein
VKIRTAAFIAAFAVVGVPAGALAAKPATAPTHPTTPASTNAAKPTVMVVLHGTITAYTAVNGTTNGSVSLNVTSSNHFASALRGSATFVIGTSSRVVGTPTVGHKATLKWRATKAPTTSAPAGAVVQLIDQGAS